MVKSTRCLKCKKVFVVSELKDNHDDFGMICIDKKTCQERAGKNRKESSK